jgi:WD40 repeat protein
VAFSADGRRLVTSGVCDGATKLWNAHTGAPITQWKTTFNRDCTFRSTGQRFSSIVTATGPGGAISAVAGPNGTVQLFGADGQLVRKLPGGHQGVQAIAFDATGKRVATGNWEGTAIVWDTATGRPLRTFATRGGIVESLRFSPDDTELARGDEDTTAKLWDLRAGRQMITFTGPTSALTDVEFSPDGTRLATTSDDGTVRVYVLPVDELMRIARARLTRTWASAECRQYLPGGRCPTSP